MLFLENPFYILGVTPRAGEQEIRRMQEERRLFGEGERADRAAEMLLEPGARLCAELGWMPGVDESDARMLVSKFRWGDPADLEDFAGAARLNLLVWNIRRRRYGSAQERAADLMEAERILGKLSAREVASCISADRAQAGFPPAGEEEVSAAMAGWLEELTAEICACMQELTGEEQRAALEALLCQKREEFGQAEGGLAAELAARLGMPFGSGSATQPAGNIEAEAREAQPAGSTVVGEVRPISNAGAEGARPVGNIESEVGGAQPAGSTTAGMARPISNAEAPTSEMGKLAEELAFEGDAARLSAGLNRLLELLSAGRTAAESGLAERLAGAGTRMAELDWEQGRKYLLALLPHGDKVPGLRRSAERALVSIQGKRGKKAQPAGRTTAGAARPISNAGVESARPAGNIEAEVGGAQPAGSTAAGMARPISDAGAEGVRPVGSAVAAQERPALPNVRYSVKLISDQIKIPPYCSCCMKYLPEEPEIREAMAKVETLRNEYGDIVNRERSWKIPMCEECKRHHMQMRASRIKLMIISGLAGTLFTCLIFWIFGIFFVFFVPANIAMACLAYAIIGKLMRVPIIKPECTTFDMSVISEARGDGATVLLFSNREYARLFGKLNRDRISMGVQTEKWKNPAHEKTMLGAEERKNGRFRIFVLFMTCFSLLICPILAFIF